HGDHRARVLLQGHVLDLLRDVDPLDTAALPLRPADGPRLEVHDPREPRLHHAGVRRPVRGRARRRPGHAAPAPGAHRNQRRVRRGPVPRRGPGSRHHGVGVPAGAPSRPPTAPTSQREPLMAIGVKVLHRPESQVSYVRATLKGMALTFKHMFEKRVTMQYPEEKSTDGAHGMGPWSLTPRWRGTHRMLTDEEGRSKCVACGLCP